MSRWKRFRHRLEEWGCRVLAWGLPRLSRRSCVLLGNALGAAAFRIDARGQAVALQNLSCVFGAKYTSTQRTRIARASYQNFVRTMIDLFWTSRLNQENFREFMHLEGFAELRKRLDREKRGAVFVCVHQGNWEWASLAFGFLGMPTTIVAENFKNPRLTAIFCALRQRSGHTIIAQEKSILRLLKIAKRGGTTGLLIDLNIPPTQAATAIEAFGPDGLKMCVPLLHAILAHRAGALLVPVESRPQRDGACRIIAHPPVECSAGASVSEIAQRCWAAFEPIVYAQPELWLWAYKHFRFRPRATARAYPDYANESTKFERVLRASVSSSSSSPD